MTKLRAAIATVLLSSAAAAAVTTIVPVGPFGLSQEQVQPTEEHKALLKGVGEWEGELTMMIPGMDPMSVPAKDTVTAVGGFWTRSNFHSEFPGMGPYHGTGVVGYDPATKKYSGTWVDSVSTTLVVMEGEMNADGELVMHWEAPVMGMEGMQPHHSVSVHGDDTSVMKFYVGEGDSKVHQMTISMKRKK